VACEVGTTASFCTCKGKSQKKRAQQKACRGGVPIRWVEGSKPRTDMLLYEDVGVYVNEGEERGSDRMRERDQ
jgi:hypothetical protein